MRKPMPAWLVVVLTLTALCAALLGSLTVAAPAHADGLSSCKEDPDTLQAEARKTIEIISEKVPLGPYETAGTVLQFVNKSLSGVGNITMPCSDIMAYYATGRISGSINAPTGPGLS